MVHGGSGLGGARWWLGGSGPVATVWPLPHWPADLSKLPVVCAARRLDAAEAGWLDRVAALRRGAGFFWLDGAASDAGAFERARAESRHSFAGIDPWATLCVRGRRIELDVHRAFHPALEPGRHESEGDPLDALRRLVPRLEGPGADLPFVGGAVGVFGYELAPRLPALARLGSGVAGTRSDERPADCVFLLVDRLLARDAETGALMAVGLGASEGKARAAADALALASRRRDPAGEALLRQRFDAPVEPAAPNVEPRAEDHARRVGRILDHIREGDCYQACLTHAIELDAPADPFVRHAALRARNPAPFAATLTLPDGVLVSSSPERFLRVDAKGRLESRPIKGTCRRDPDPDRDAAARAALARSEKDRAENLMIVDLVRNDLGRVCELGSVHVPELFSVERFASVSHLVSTIRGQLRPGLDALDAVAACFPAGSMTGAPKLAAMRILRALEPARRGAYSGALGYLDVAGGLDLSVVIRTALVRDGVASIGTGGGIVLDSEAHLEWEEARDKTRALREAIRAARAFEAARETSAPELAVP